MLMYNTILLKYYFYRNIYLYTYSTQYGLIYYKYILDNETLVSILL